MEATGEHRRYVFVLAIDLLWLVCSRAVLSVRPSSGVRRESRTRTVTAGPDWMINIKKANTMMMMVMLMASFVGVEF